MTKDRGQNYLTWAEVDLKAIEHNVIQIRQLAARNTFSIPLRSQPKKKIVNPMEILAVIKADAYGHGMKEVGILLERLGINYFGVSDIEEGMHLRNCSIKKPILLFESTLPQDVQEIMRSQLIPSICTLEMALGLNDYAKRIGKKVNVHINVDTGMGRLGIWHKDAHSFIKEITKDYRYLNIQGIYTHFPAADTARVYTENQIKQLHELVLRCDQDGLIIPYIHAANSIGLTDYKTHILNLARPGLMIYGLHPYPSLRGKPKLKPALSVRSRIIFLKTIEKGRSISYGRSFISKGKMKVATIPIGYNDGYLRALSNKAAVLVDGIRCPVLGLVTMDQIVIDVTKVNGVSLGMVVTVLGEDNGKSITADELAKSAKTINYEIVCHLGNRLPRVFS